MTAPTDYQRFIDSLTDEIWRRLQEDQSRGPGASSCSCQASHAPCSQAHIELLVDCGACRVSVHPPALSVEPATSAIIDHTLLRADATREDVIKLCEEAARYGFASVCVNPTWVPLAAERLRQSKVKVCTVCGFPLGATLPAVKKAEACEAVNAGANEVDMVINVGALKSGDWDFVKGDIAGVVDTCHSGGAITKVILETALLNDEEKVAGCLLSRAAGADFVKTSTGFSTGGATVHDIELMRFTVGREVGVKASGGVRTLEDVRKMVAAGATRIGASASVKIMEEAAGRKPASSGPSAY